MTVVSEVSCARVPVSDAELVTMLMNGEKNRFGGLDEIERDFHEQFFPLICYFVQHNSVDLGDEEDDVIQECYLSVRRKLAKFDPERAKLSTYIGHICRSVVYTYWRRKMSKRLAHFVTVDDETNITEGEVRPPNHLGETIRVTICELFDDYPEKRAMLVAMFGGDPREDEDYSLPEKISCAEISRSLGVNYNDVHNFYRNTVTPYFKERVK